MIKNPFYCNQVTKSETILKLELSEPWVMAVYFHLPHPIESWKKKMMKMIFGNAFMSTLDFELTNADNASACTTGFSRPMLMQSLPKTADVVMMELVGLSINQIEICWLCNTSNSLAEKAFFNHEQQNNIFVLDQKKILQNQNNTTIFDFWMVTNWLHAHTRALP